MDFEWDEEKRLRTLRERGIDFELAIEVWAGRVVERADPRDYDGETRFVCFGEVDGRLHAVVYTWRGDVRRIISARKANERERRAYHAALSRDRPDEDG